MPKITGTFEDREQIREIYARYANTVDAGQFDAWIDCFTPDGVFESPLMGRFAGQEELRKFTQQYHHSWAGGGVRHMMVNVSFEVTGDTATVLNLGAVHLPHDRHRRLPHVRGRLGEGAGQAA